MYINCFICGGVCFCYRQQLRRPFQLPPITFLTIGLSTSLWALFSLLSSWQSSCQMVTSNHLYQFTHEHKTVRVCSGDSSWSDRCISRNSCMLFVAWLDVPEIKQFGQHKEMSSQSMLCNKQRMFYSPFSVSHLSNCQSIPVY